MTNDVLQSIIDELAESSKRLDALLIEQRDLKRRVVETRRELCKLVDPDKSVHFVAKNRAIVAIGARRLPPLDRIVLVFQEDDSGKTEDL